MKKEDSQNKKLINGYKQIFDLVKQKQNLFDANQNQNINDRYINNFNNNIKHPNPTSSNIQSLFKKFDDI